MISSASLGKQNSQHNQRNIYTFKLTKKKTPSARLASVALATGFVAGQSAGNVMSPFAQTRFAEIGKKRAGELKRKGSGEQPLSDFRVGGIANARGMRALLKASSDQGLFSNN
jgi:hypothetical protein